ncbi:MAG: glutathione S-transferase [Betaproteobacteria bacterium]|nr:glutathione S-transferase [Betaproteobacteria bacterium]
MKLIMTPTSPFARKARIVMAEKRIEYESVVDNPWEADSRVSDYNPLGMVPVLVLDDNSTLFDSRVIVEYLDTVSPVSQLIPKDSRQRLSVRRWEALADGISDAAAAIFIEKKRPESQQSPEWIERQEKKVFLGVAAMAEELGDKSWCTGEFFNLSDIAAGCALGYLDLRHPAIEWRRTHPVLARLADKLSQRPSFKETLPPAA